MITRGARALACAMAVLSMVAAARACHATMPPLAGAVPAEVRSASRAGLFAVPARVSPAASRRVGQVETGPAVWRVPVIIVSYSDSLLTHVASEWNRNLFDTTQASPTGSVYDYYQWASHGTLRVIPVVVATVQVPNGRDYYGAGAWGLARLDTPRNSAGFVKDALLRTIRTVTVDWSQFDNDRDGYVDMVWVVHAGRGGEASGNPNDLWSMTARLTVGWFNVVAFDTEQQVQGSQFQHYLVDRFSILPEQSAFHRGALSEIGVYCHEFGHALGLPDLYDTLDPMMLNTGPGNWSLMSTGAYGGDGHTPEYPARPGAWCELFLGWSQRLRPTRDTTLVFAPIGRGGQVLELSFQGESNPEHFLVEYRRREGFDRSLVNDGLIVYHVDESLIGQRIGGNAVNAGPNPALMVVEADGRGDLRTGADHGDPSDPYPGQLSRNYLADGIAEPTTRTLHGNISNVALFNVVPQGDSIRFDVQVRSPGWLAAADRGDPDFSPASALSASGTVVGDANGDIATVGGEMRSGRAQVILRTRVNGAWQPAMQISASSADARDPTIALLPGGDLATVWVDTRSGRPRLFYRARVRGRWGVEQQLVDGDAFAPCAVGDARGGVQVTWLASAGGRSQVMFMRVSYLSPFGIPHTMSGAADAPGAPVIAGGGIGSSVLVWPDQANGGSVWFARFHPDSGIGPRLPLVPGGFGSPQAVHAALDTSGALHSVWLLGGPGLSELHYQRRTRTGLLADTTLVSAGGVVQNPRIAVDPASGSAHIVFQRLVQGLSQVCYKRWNRTRSWEEGNTELSDLAVGTATRPVVVPQGPANVTVLFTGNVAGVPRFMERRRLGEIPPAMAVDPPARPSPGGLRLAPNPLHAGAALRLTLEAAAADHTIVDLFDIGGRRVASVLMTGRLGVLPASATAGWPGGVYFARERANTRAARIVFVR